MRTGARFGAFCPNIIHRNFHVHPTFRRPDHTLRPCGVRVNLPGTALWINTVRNLGRVKSRLVVVSKSGQLERVGEGRGWQHATAVQMQTRCILQLFWSKY